MPDRKYGELPWQGFEDWISKLMGSIPKQERSKWEAFFSYYLTPEEYRKYLPSSKYIANPPTQPTLARMMAEQPQAWGTYKPEEVAGWQAQWGAREQERQQAQAQQASEMEMWWQDYGAPHAQAAESWYRGQQQQRARGWQTPTPKAKTEPSQTEMANLWEQYRQQTLSGLDPNRDFLARFFLEAEENPYGYKKRSDKDKRRYEEAQAEGAGYVGPVEQFAMTGPTIPKSPYSLRTFPYTVSVWGEAIKAREEYYQNYLTRAKERAEEDINEAWVEKQEERAEKATKLGYTDLAGEIKRKIGRGKQASSYVRKRKSEEKKQAAWEAKTPPAPAWLKAHWPEATVTKGGYTGMKKTQLGAPSMQFWNKLKEGERQQYMGFTEWSGQDPTDLLRQMETMLPSRTPQAGRWKPFRQRA